MSEVREALSQYGKAVVNTARQLMDKQKRNASGNTRKALRFWITETKEGYRLSIGARGKVGKYLKWVAEGRGAGKRPPVRNIEEWIKNKRIKLRDKRGRFKKMTSANIRSAAFAISKKIGEQGTRPKPNFLEMAVDANADKLEDVKKESVKEVGVGIRQSLKQLKFAKQNQ